MEERRVAGEGDLLGATDTFSHGYPVLGAPDQKLVCSWLLVVVKHAGIACRAVRHWPSMLQLFQPPSSRCPVRRNLPVVTCVSSGLSEF